MALIHPGNYVHWLNGYDGEGVRLFPGFTFFHQMGFVELTTTLGSSFDVILPARDKNKSITPNKTGLVVPQGAYLYHLGLRIEGKSLTGTTGERLKLATAQTDSAGYPAIVAANNAYAVGKVSVDTVDFGSITPLASAQTLRLLVSNAGNTAAGAGVRATTGTQKVLCDVAYFFTGDMPHLELLGG